MPECDEIRNVAVVAGCAGRPRSSADSRLGDILRLQARNFAATSQQVDSVLLPTKYPLFVDDLILSKEARCYPESPLLSVPLDASSHDARGDTDPIG